MKRILSGIQPTNDLTLGNYLGSIKQFVEMQNEYEMFIFVADLHAITTGNIDSNGLYNNSLNLINSLSFLLLKDFPIPHKKTDSIILVFPCALSP